MLANALQGLGQMLGAASPLFAAMGPGAHAYKSVEAAPGKYYVPSQHPYQQTLTGGLDVQAMPGQYYRPQQVPPGIMPSMQGLAGMFPLPYPKWACALAGAAAGAGVGYGGTKYYASKKMPPLPTKKKKDLPVQVAIASAIGGAIAGYLMCGPAAEPAPQPPSNTSSLFRFKPDFPTTPVPR